jgi:hypothetical protein
VSEPPAGWSVLIKQASRGTRTYEGDVIVQVLPADSFEHAVSVAEWAAVNYRPHQPMIPKRRDVFRVDDHNWVVQLEGVARSFHFTATIARWTGTYPQ